MAAFVRRSLFFLSDINFDDAEKKKKKKKKRRRRRRGVGCSVANLNVGAGDRGPPLSLETLR